MESEESKVIIEDADGITIAIRHDWRRFREDELSTLTTYTIVGNAVGSGGIYQVLRNINPLDFLQRVSNEFMLVKYVTDEETGKVIVLAVKISSDEATAIINMEPSGRCL